MKLVRKQSYIRRLHGILRYIALDKPATAVNFERQLNARLELVKDNPWMCRPSRHIANELYRDLIYQGYTLIYKVEAENLLLLDIFKWQHTPSSGALL